jgi:hypothetical protein
MFVLGKFCRELHTDLRTASTMAMAAAAAKDDCEKIRLIAPSYCQSEARDY